MTLRDQVTAGFHEGKAKRGQRDWSESGAPQDMKTQGKRGPVFGMSQEDVRVAVRVGTMLYEMEGRKITRLTHSEPTSGWIARPIGGPKELDIVNNGFQEVE